MSTGSTVTVCSGDISTTATVICAVDGIGFLPGGAVVGIDSPMGSHEPAARSVLFRWMGK